MERSSLLPTRDLEGYLPLRSYLRNLDTSGQTSRILILKLRSIQTIQLRRSCYSPFSEGTLIKKVNVDAVYVIADGRKQGFASGTAFENLGYQSNRIVVLPATIIDLISENTQAITDSSVTFCATALGGAADELGPSLSITSQSDGQTVTISTVTISGTASDAGRGDSGTSSITVNGIPAGGDTAVGSGTAYWSQNISLNIGSNLITVIARDNSPALNATQQQLTLNYQPSTPSPTPTPPGSGVPIDFAWQYKQSIPAATWGAASTVYNGQIYVLAGC